MTGKPGASPGKQLLRIQEQTAFYWPSLQGQFEAATTAERSQACAASQLSELTPVVLLSELAQGFD